MSESRLSSSRLRPTKLLARRFGVARIVAGWLRECVGIADFYGRQSQQAQFAVHIPAMAITHLRITTLRGGNWCCSRVLFLQDVISKLGPFVGGTSCYLIDLSSNSDG